MAAIRRPLSSVENLLHKGAIPEIGLSKSNLNLSNGTSDLSDTCTKYDKLRSIIGLYVVDTLIASRALQIVDELEVEGDSFRRTVLESNVQSFQLDESVKRVDNQVLQTAPQPKLNSFVESSSENTDNEEVILSKHDNSTMSPVKIPLHSGREVSPDALLQPVAVIPIVRRSNRRASMSSFTVLDTLQADIATKDKKPRQPRTKKATGVDLENKIPLDNKLPFAPRKMESESACCSPKKSPKCHSTASPSRPDCERPWLSEVTAVTPVILFDRNDLEPILIFESISEDVLEINNLEIDSNLLTKAVSEDGQLMAIEINPEVQNVLNLNSIESVCNERLQSPVRSDQTETILPPESEFTMEIECNQIAVDFSSETTNTCPTTINDGFATFSFQTPRIILLPSDMRTSSGNLSSGNLSEIDNSDAFSSSPTDLAPMISMLTFCDQINPTDYDQISQVNHKNDNDSGNDDIMRMTATMVDTDTVAMTAEIAVDSVQYNNIRLFQCESDCIPPLPPTPLFFEFNIGDSSHEDIMTPGNDFLMASTPTDIGPITVESKRGRKKASEKISSSSGRRSSMRFKASTERYGCEFSAVDATIAQDVSTVDPQTQTQTQAQTAAMVDTQIIPPVIDIQLTVVVKETPKRGRHKSKTIRYETPLEVISENISEEINENISEEIISRQENSVVTGNGISVECKIQGLLDDNNSSAVDCISILDHKVVSEFVTVVVGEVAESNGVTDEEHGQIDGVLVQEDAVSELIEVVERQIVEVLVLDEATLGGKEVELGQIEVVHSSVEEFSCPNIFNYSSIDDLTSCETEGCSDMILTMTEDSMLTPIAADNFTGEVDCFSSSSVDSFLPVNSRLDISEVFNSNEILSEVIPSLSHEDDWLMQEHSKMEKEIDEKYENNENNDELRYQELLQWCCGDDIALDTDIALENTLDNVLDNNLDNRLDNGLDNVPNSIDMDFSLDPDPFVTRCLFENDNVDHIENGDYIENVDYKDFLVPINDIISDINDTTDLLGLDESMSYDTLPPLPLPPLLPPTEPSELLCVEDNDIKLLCEESNDMKMLCEQEKNMELLCEQSDDILLSRLGTSSMYECQDEDCIFGVSENNLQGEGRMSIESCSSVETIICPIICPGVCPIVQPLLIPKTSVQTSVQTTVKTSEILLTAIIPILPIISDQLQLQLQSWTEELQPMTEECQGEDLGPVSDSITDSMMDEAIENTIYSTIIYRTIVDNISIESALCPSSGRHCVVADSGSTTSTNISASLTATLSTKEKISILLKQSIASLPMQECHKIITGTSSNSLQCAGSSSSLSSSSGVGFVTVLLSLMYHAHALSPLSQCHDNMMDMSTTTSTSPTTSNSSTTSYELPLSPSLLKIATALSALVPSLYSSESETESESEVDMTCPQSEVRLIGFKSTETEVGLRLIGPKSTNKKCKKNVHFCEIDGSSVTTPGYAKSHEPALRTVRRLHSLIRNMDDFICTLVSADCTDCSDNIDNAENTIARNSSDNSSVRNNCASSVSASSSSYLDTALSCCQMLSDSITANTVSLALEVTLSLQVNAGDVRAMAVMLMSELMAAQKSITQKSIAQKFEAQKCVVETSSGSSSSNITSNSTNTSTSNSTGLAGVRTVSTGLAGVRTVLRHRTGWMATSVLRAQLRWLLDPPPIMLTAKNNGAYSPSPFRSCIIHQKIALKEGKRSYNINKKSMKLDTIPIMKMPFSSLLTQALRQVYDAYVTFYSLELIPIDGSVDLYVTQLLIGAVTTNTVSVNTTTTVSDSVGEVSDCSIVAQRNNHLEGLESTQPQVRTIR